MDWQAVLQVILVVCLTVSGVVIANLLKTKYNINKNDLDLFYIINELVSDTVVDNETAKKISRVIGKCVRYVESSLTNEKNEVKLQMAYDLACEAITALGINAPIDEENLKKIIELAVSFMDATHRENDVDLNTLI